MASVRLGQDGIDYSGGYEPGGITGNPSVPASDLKIDQGTGFTPMPGPTSPTVYTDPSLGSNIANGTTIGARMPDPVTLRTSAPQTTPQADPYAWVDQALQSAQSTDDPNYWKSVIAQKSTGNDQAYWIDRINRGNGSALVKNGSMSLFQDGPAGGAGGAVPSPNTSVFSDPATQQYEQMINQMMGRLNTPTQAPDYQSSIDALKSYMAQLNGPAYTPQQTDLMQTQALDPLASQRDSARQQIIQHFATMGVPSSSGIVQSALLNSDQNFEKLRTQTQAGFATNAIGMQKQQQAQAAGLAPQIAALEQANQTQNENRQMQAVNLGGIVPQTAWQRLTGANSLVQPINTASLLQQLIGANTSNSNANATGNSFLADALWKLYQSGAFG